MPSSFKIDSDGDDIVLRFDRRLVNPQALYRLLDYVERASIQQKSTLSQDEADALADEIDRTVWEQVKDKYST
jgi:hypothetical protein